MTSRHDVTSWNHYTYLTYLGLTVIDNLFYGYLLGCWIHNYHIYIGIMIPQGRIQGSHRGPCPPNGWQSFFTHLVSQLYGSTTVVMATHGLHWKWQSLTPCQRHPSEPIEKIFGAIDYVIDLNNLAKFGFGKIFGDGGTYTQRSSYYKGTKFLDTWRLVVLWS